MGGGGHCQYIYMRKIYFALTPRFVKLNGLLNNSSSAIYF